MQSNLYVNVRQGTMNNSHSSYNRSCEEYSNRFLFISLVSYYLLRVFKYFITTCEVQHKFISSINILVDEILHRSSENISSETANSANQQNVNPIKPKQKEVNNEIYSTKTSMQLPTCWSSDVHVIVELNSLDPSIRNSNPPNSSLLWSVSKST